MLIISFFRLRNYCSNFSVIWSLQFAISSGVLTACTMDNLFKYSDTTLVFVYFFVFGLSAIMLSFFISTFFKRAKTAVAVGTLSFLGAFLPYYSVNDEGVSMWVLALPITNISIVQFFIYLSVCFIHLRLLQDLEGCCFFAITYGLCSGFGQLCWLWACSCWTSLEQHMAGDFLRYSPCLYYFDLFFFPNYLRQLYCRNHLE